MSCPRGAQHAAQLLGQTDDGLLRYRCGNCDIYGHAPKDGDPVVFEEEGAPDLHPANQASSIAGS